MPTAAAPPTYASHAFTRTLTWRGGFWLALVIPMSGLTLVGYEIGALGAWGALTVWLGTSVIALLQNFIYAELAGMHPEASGGTEQLISLSVIVVGLLSYFFTRYVQLGVRGRALWSADSSRETA